MTTSVSTPVVDVPQDHLSNITAWIHFMQKLFSLKVGMRVGIQHQLELLGQYGYDTLSHYFCEEAKQPHRQFHSLQIGETARRTVIITKWRIFFFALVSEDWNRLHFDSTFASKTRFREPIGHGLILGGIVSALLGTELPGIGTYYISQEWRFKGPTKIGDEVMVKISITNIDQEKRRVTLFTGAYIDDKLIATGEALAGIDDFPYKGP